ncbi:SRPBCC family protein [Phyllobacterium salinisoli]|uniref:SRPBCC family protein n=1 Tax=Phyllobacterium salinisoli TaxID=1899321 RepID=A0A368K8I7_9HYPH|nr:SRPBCC family protein [Phyllobacterium salinisoli]RCS25534.1 SRPBCC family protein [Phyllobacterium salinisoli]
MSTYESHTISIAIDRPWLEVSPFLARPENFPLWASGLASGLEKSAEGWFADGPSGRVRILFSPSNEFGVADHTVILADGTEVYIPLRVIRNGSGSEVIFTLFRIEGMDEERFLEDAGWVKRDLQQLKALLENAPS